MAVMPAGTVLVAGTVSVPASDRLELSHHGPGSRRAEATYDAP